MPTWSTSPSSFLLFVFETNRMFRTNRVSQRPRTGPTVWCDCVYMWTSSPPSLDLKRASGSVR